MEEMEMKSLSKVFLAPMAVLFAGMFFLVGAAPVLADDATDAKNLVEKARMSFNSFETAKEMGGFRDLIKKAKGVFISPSILKGAFIVGASGGSGVFLSRDKKTNKWFGPAFYTMGEASFGLQIGGSASEVVLLAMTDRGVTAFLSNNFKLGADGSIAAANLSADIISFSRSKGLFGGVSVDGAVVGVRDSLNDAYYGKKVSPTDILVKHNVANKGAAGLITAVNKASAAK